jgi:hypothetical protein
MSEPLGGPLVSAKWAVLLGAVGVGLGVYAQLAPQDLQLLVAFFGSTALYAATGELRQPEWAKGKVLVPVALAPVLHALGVAAHGYAQQAGVPLAHVLGAVAWAAAGYAKQETLGAPNKLRGLVCLALAAGSLQGCAHKAASAPPAHELVSEAPESTSAPEAIPERPPDHCRRLDDARLFWGVWSKVCGTLTGGAGAGAIATTGDPQRVVGLSGLGLLACAVATGYLETELAVRHTAQCSER